jgi:hypothetical protein
MALLNKLVERKTGFSGELVYLNAYWKVTKINGDKTAMFFDVTVFTEKNGETLAQRQYSYVPTLEGDNFIAQAYQHLKKLKDFESATDY